MSEDPAVQSVGRSSVKASERVSQIQPFLVMEVLEAAQAMERRGIDIVHMEVGEPGFDTPELIVNSAVGAMTEGQTHYTHSLGLVELRRAISDWHLRTYGTKVDPECIIVTSGTSPAMLLSFMAICNPGDEVIITDPHYACYPNLIVGAGAIPVRVPVSPEDGFRPRPRIVREAISEKTRAFVLNSPSNPTGALVDAETLEALAGIGLLIVSDEIYHGLVYRDRAHSMLEFTDHCIVVNGFSKLFAMTGWRLGYAIVPPELVRPIQKLQQNFFISASHFGQIGAITALSRRSEKHVREMVREYDRRRRFLLAGLTATGLKVHGEPEGAFYVFADARHYCEELGLNSYQLAFDILEKARVALTPGSDFGPGGEGFLRISYATDYGRIGEGLARVEAYFRDTSRRGKGRGR